LNSCFTGVTPQDIYYYTERMIDADLIAKDTSNGIKWRLKEKGKFLLKQKLTGSVNPFNNYQTRSIPVRLDNIAFEFKILSAIPTNTHFKWNEMKNDVSKCSLKYDSYTVELSSLRRLLLCLFIWIKGTALTGQAS
jgi:hypothetical protein